MAKSLLEQLPEIAANGRKEAERSWHGTVFFVTVFDDQAGGANTLYR